MEKYAINYSSNMNDGIIASAKVWYPYLSASEKNQIFLQRRMKLGDRIGFSGLNMIMNTQKNAKSPDKYEDGKAILITKQMIEGKKDLYMEVDPVCDIMMLSHETPGVSLMYAVADCPTITVEDPTQGILAFAHCGCEYIDRNLPMQTVEALQKEAGSKIENLKIYVGPHAQINDYIYAGYPNWAKNGMKEHLYPITKPGFEDKNLYMVDIDGALAKQFKQAGIKDENVYYSPENTITDNYYSNSISSQRYFDPANRNPNKNGRFATGAFYPLDDNVYNTAERVPNKIYVKK